ncbi:MAG: hypothetical protein ACP5QA_03340 [Phycisphaerae bacterium]
MPFRDLPGGDVRRLSSTKKDGLTVISTLGNVVRYPSERGKMRAVRAVKNNVRSSGPGTKNRTDVPGFLTELVE